MIKLSVNGVAHSLDVPDDMPLLWVLRDELDLKGPKYGCGVAQCGACTVHIDGNPVRACITPVGSVDGAVTTLEALVETPLGAKVRQAWLDLDVMQCGYCQGGQIMSAVALLKEPWAHNDDAIREAMSGNICRCGAYRNILDAVRSVRGDS